MNGTNIEVLADGEDCRVTDSGLDFIKCVTSGTGSVSPIGYQPGQPGMTQIQTDEDYNEFLKLASTFEAMNVNSSQPLSGWFKAPATGHYRFYIACNAACSLNMNYETPFDASDIQTEIPELTTIASRGWWTNWRNYHYITDDGHFSAWIELTEGDYYFMQSTGSSYMSVGVEFNELYG